MWEVDAGWKLRCAMAGCAIMAMPIWSYGARAACHRRGSRDEAVREEFPFCIYRGGVFCILQ